jgi:hypothetical protein
MLARLRCKYNCSVRDYWQQARALCGKISAQRALALA